MCILKGITGSLGYGQDIIKRTFASQIRTIMGETWGLNEFR
ncbi:hypothetical protein LAPL110952_02690 [Lactiplantibacillus plajomi]